MTELLQRCDQALLERESGVVGADRNAHDREL